MSKIVDGRVRTENLLKGEVVNSKLDSLFQKGLNASLPQTAIGVTFPTAYADTPIVMCTPGAGNSYARIISVDKVSFQWQGANGNPGTASWMAWGHRAARDNNLP